MRYIDAFNHFFPKRIYELMLESPAGQKDLGKRMRGIPALHDIEERLRVVDHVCSLWLRPRPYGQNETRTVKTRLGDRMRQRRPRNGPIRAVSL